MFGRKRTETEDNKMADEADDLGIPMKPSRPVTPTAVPVPPLAAKAPAPVPPRVPEPPRVAEPARAPEPPRQSAAPAPAPMPRRNETEVRKLIVGREISLSGGINSCDQLVVEGSVEANLQNCREVDIAESGLFKGSASIDTAEVHGRFEGTLTVRSRLFIRSTGRVSGTIRYGQLEVEAGGQLSGDIQAQPGDELISGLPGARAAH
jgi:cytoskeletal protein CcmA (bactofilin family)